MAMNNRQLKKQAAEKHNEAYLESLEPKGNNPISREAKRNARIVLGIAPLLSASVNVGTIGHIDHG
jgi:hypothetical protein